MSLPTAPIHISRNRQPIGIFSAQEVADGLQSNKFLPTDLAWSEGMESWVELASFPNIPPPQGAGATTAPASNAPLPPPPSSYPSTSLQVEPAWERRKEVGLFSALFESIKQVLTLPSNTFATMPKTGGLAGPLLYNVILSTIGAFFAFGYQMIMMIVNPESMEQEFAGFSMGIALVIGFFALLFLLPIFLIIGSFIGAAVLHFCLWIVGGARHPFETTFRVLCYAQGSTSILQVIPLCGGVVAGIWSLVATTIGLSKAHETSIGKALLAIILPIILLCGLGGLAIAFAVAIPAMLN